MAGRFSEDGLIGEEDEEEEVKETTLAEGSEVNYIHLLWSFLFPALGGLLYGFDIGAMAMVLLDLESETYSNTRWYGVLDSAALSGAVVSMVTVGAVVGSISCFRVERVLGRKNELLIASSCYGVGSVGQYLSGTPTFEAATALTVLCLARLVYGVGVGFAMHGAPSYIAETAPAHLRGTLVSAKEAMIVVGMLLGYTIGNAFSKIPGAWRYTFLAAFPLAGLMMGGLFMLPKSPRWLAIHGRHKEAEMALRYVTPQVSERTMKELVLAAREPVGNKKGLFEDGASRLAMLAGLGLVVLQQVTGQPSVLYYVATLFDDVGLGNGATIALAAWKLACTSLSVVAVDRFGRRLLLFSGIGLMTLALLILTLVTLNPAENAVYEGTILGAMFLYIGGYQVGFGPITWTVISEVFPLQLRGQALAVATVTNFTLNALVTFGASPLIQFSLPITFGIFFVLCVYSFFFVHRYVPETKGLSLEHITKMLEDRSRRQTAARPSSPLSSDDASAHLLSSGVV